MDQNRLSFTEGSVVRVSRPKYTGPKFPYPPCIEDDSVRDILESLTSQQRAALKKMAKCSKKGCGIQHLMNTNECCDGKNSLYTATICTSKAKAPSIDSDWYVS